MRSGRLCDYGATVAFLALFLDLLDDGQIFNNSNVGTIALSFVAVCFFVAAFVVWVSDE